MMKHLNRYLNIRDKHLYKKNEKKKKKKKKRCIWAGQANVRGNQLARTKVSEKYIMVTSVPLRQNETRSDG
jgi:hypothetical protein